MDYNILLDLVTDLGYELAMCGAETFRVEESINRILESYGVAAEAFAIPNVLIVSIQTEDGTPITRMRRIGHHGNDLDSVEKFSGLSRAICSRRPDPREAMEWLELVRRMRLRYSLHAQLLGFFLGSGGYALFFGGSWLDGIFGGVCGLIVGWINKLMDDARVNQFFRTIASAFLIAILAYGLNGLGLTHRPDAVSIGALMILVPGLLFTNAMRDIIYGDTNSGINRVVQVFLVAAAIALGTACAWNAASALWFPPVSAASVSWGIAAQCLWAFAGCMGFVILFNIHGPGGLLCGLGGALAWFVYLMTLELGAGEIWAYFWASAAASAYSEVTARIRKYPAISYLVISIFPMIPGAGVYYTMTHAVRGEMGAFADRLMNTAAIAGVMAMGILLVSTLFRVWTVVKMRRKA